MKSDHDRKVEAFLKMRGDGGPAADPGGLLVVAFVDAGPMLVGTFPNSDEADTACRAFLLMYPNVQFSELEMPSPVEKTRLGNWSSYAANQADWANSRQEGLGLLP